MKVYVIEEEGSWDYELTHHVEAYASFEDAVNSYRNLVKNARFDMKEQIKNSDDIAECEQIDEEAEKPLRLKYTKMDTIHNFMTLLKLQNTIYKGGNIDGRLL